MNHSEARRLPRSFVTPPVTIFLNGASNILPIRPSVGEDGQDVTVTVFEWVSGGPDDVPTTLLDQPALI